MDSFKHFLDDFDVDFHIFLQQHAISFPSMSQATVFLVVEDFGCVGILIVD